MGGSQQRVSAIESGSVADLRVFRNPRWFGPGATPDSAGPCQVHRRSTGVNAASASSSATATTSARSAVSLCTWGIRPSVADRVRRSAVAMFARISQYHLTMPGIVRQRNRRSSGQNDTAGALSGSTRTQDSRLLIRGFGVQVPGGALALTWCYTRFGRPRGGRFGARFAPRLLVSPDLVPRAVLVGLAPARSARPSVPSRPQRQLQSGPTDGITQRDTCRIAQLEGAGPRPPGTREVHRRYMRGTSGCRHPSTARTSFARSCC
jgi:hypothetical protein